MIIDRIRKLMALSESANEHEASLALQRAQALMQKHAVSIESVADTTTPDQATHVRMAIPAGTFLEIMLYTTARAFNCEVILDKRAKKAFIFGRELHITMCTVAWASLEPRISHLRSMRGKEAQKDFLEQHGYSMTYARNNLRGRWFKGYEAGVIDAFAAIVDQQLAQWSQGDGKSLIIAFNDENQAAIEKEFCSLVKAQTRTVKVYDMSAYNSGYSDGSSLDLRKGLTDDKS